MCRLGAGRSDRGPDDLNTDPGRLGTADESAVLWNDFVGDDKPFHFISDVGEDAEPSYSGLFNIDHVVSDSLMGDCWVAGVDVGRPPVTDAIYFDHNPIVCRVE